VALDKPEDTFVTVDQAAKIIKLHPKTVRRYCHEGKIEFRRDGKKMLISKRTLTEIAS
jgi:excisionase family DNA binding protein